MTPLEAALVARIGRDGPMTFRDVMAQALYHSEHGYYTSGRPWRGRGDFTTAPAYGDLLAAAIARFAAAAKAAMGPGRFEVVEVGSGSGKLAAQLLPLLKEDGIGLRSVEHRRPPELPREVPWSATLDGLDLRGLVVSNELFDALPVHRVARTAEGLREWLVGVEGGRLVPRLGEVSRPEVAGHVARWFPDLEEGCTVEVNLEAPRMLATMAKALREGVLLTIDYGGAARELLHLGRGGTLTAYHEHRLAPDPLARPGEQDLTAHVNFSALEDEGMALGLAPLANVPQWRFLLAQGVLAGLAERLQHASTFEDALAAKTLVAPGRMGEFRVLAQAKGLAPPAKVALARRLADGQTV